MLQPGRLAGYRLYPSVVAVSQAVDADTAGKINIFLAFRIHGDRTLTGSQSHRKPAICRHHMLGFLLLNL